jgi:anti-sigma28 factor (negative regulator of flagellin synthesis)
MGIREKNDWFVRSERAAAPARAREVIRANADSLAMTEATSDGAATPAPAHAPRLAELRARVQQGTYSVDLQALSRKMVDEHLKWRG